MPCPCWRSRPIGPPDPPGPLLGGRRPRRRLFFPPPPEGCRDPAFMFLFILTWLPGLIVSSSPRLRHAVGVGGYALTNGRTSHKPLNCYRERCSNQLGALELCAKGQPRSMAVGNILMLLMKASPAQGGNVHSFAHPGITKGARAFLTGRGGGGNTLRLIAWQEPSIGGVGTTLFDPLMTEIRIASIH